MLRALKDRIKDVEATLTEQFLTHLDEGDVKAATLDDGIRLGKVSKVSGRTTAISNGTENEMAGACSLI